MAHFCSFIHFSLLSPYFPLVPSFPISLSLLLFFPLLNLFSFIVIYPPFGLHFLPYPPHFPTVPHLFLPYFPRRPHPALSPGYIRSIEKSPPPEEVAMPEEPSIDMEILSPQSWEEAMVYVGDEINIEQVGKINFSPFFSEEN